MTVQIYKHIEAEYMDVIFPYKEAIKNAYGLIGHTTTHVASLCLREEKLKVSQLYFMVKQVFEAVYFDTPFNPVVEEAAERK